MGRMSSNRMPGEGKSGNCRSASWSLILRLESSAAVAEAVGESRGFWAEWVVASGASGGG